MRGRLLRSLFRRAASKRLPKEARGDAHFRISGSPRRTEKAQDGVSHVAPGTADGEGKGDKVAGVCTSWCRRAFFEPHPTQVDADVEMEDDSGAELDQIAAKSATGPSMEPLGAQPNIPGASGRQRMH